MGPIVWQGREYPSGVLPPENVLWEVLWELYEVNFIHELQSLDRRACHGLDLSKATQLFNRETLISQCFNTSSFQQVSIPSEKSWIGWWWLRQALPVCHWSGLHHELMERRKTCQTVQRSLRFAIDSRWMCGNENIVLKYYCQQFFNYLGRAAQVPHRLFVTSLNWFWPFSFYIYLFIENIMFFLRFWVGKLAVI